MSLMVDVCVEALNKYDVECIMIDSPVSSCSKWSAEVRRLIMERLENPFVGFSIICENRAESKFKEVALASVFARCRWLAHMQSVSDEIHAETGIRIKSGVTTEEACKLFLKNNPNSKFIRKSWKL
jgi:ribonuclease HII